MVPKFLLVIVLFIGAVKSEDYYKKDAVSPTIYGVQPYGYFRAPIYPQKHRGHPVLPGTNVIQGEDKGIYHTEDATDGDYYRGNILKNTVHEEQDSGLKATSGTKGHHAVAAGNKGKEDYAGHWSGRGLQGAGVAASGKVQEYGATGKLAYDGSGKTGFKKGHNKSGFQKSHNMEESGKDSEVVDEDLKVGRKTFVKSYGGKFGEFGKSGSGEVLKGLEYDHSALGSGTAKSVQDSARKHDLTYDQRGHSGEYKKKDSLIGEKGLHANHDHHEKSGTALGILDEVKTLHHKLFYHP